MLGWLPWLLPGTISKQIDKAFNHGVSVLKKGAEGKGKSPNLIQDNGVKSPSLCFTLLY